jgi:hypothetical protein
VLRRVFLTILTAAAAICLALLAIAFAQAYRARAFGNEFLADVRNLRVGQSTYQDALRVQAKYRSRWSSELGDCDQNLCDMAFSAGNEWLYRLGLVPGAIFIGGLRVRQGVLVRIIVSYQSNSHYDANTEETVAGPGGSAYEVGGKKIASERTYSYVWARITSAATPGEPEKGYAYNLACLTKLGGCKDANKILPILPSLTGAEQSPPPPPSD